MMRKLNKYFFGEEEISTQDKVWFYGMYMVVAVVMIPVIVIKISL